MSKELSYINEVDSEVNKIKSMIINEKDIRKQIKEEEKKEQNMKMNLMIQMKTINIKKTSKKLK